MIKDWPILAGEAFDSAQERGGARVAVVGHTVALDLFGTSSPLGQRLMVNRVPFIVIGVLTERPRRRRMDPSERSRGRHTRIRAQ